VLNRCAALLVLGASLLPLRGQEDGPIKMSPEFALALPFVQVGKDVMLKFPVLINRTTVIKPGMILRVMYIPPMQSDSTDLVLAHKGDMAQSYSRPVGEGAQSSMPPEVAHEIEKQRRTVWEVPVNFQLAMAQLPTDNLHVIFSTSGDNRNLDDERFNFFEGLLLGSPTPGVTVLAVENGSKADQAGFKAGDQVLAVGRFPVSNDLAAFTGTYGAARQEAKDAQAETFSFVVRSPGEAGSHTLKMAMPPTIKSLLMQGF
jgi:hypothetical protein